MINPLDLQNAIVDKLRAIPALIALVGDMGSIQAYDDESQTDGTLDGSELGMMDTAILVGWLGAQLPRMGETRGWTHQFKIVLKADSIMVYYQLAQLIFDGIPDGEYDTFLNCMIHQDCDGIQNAELNRDTTDGVDRLAIQFTLTERA